MNSFVIWNSIQHNSKSIANFAIITRKNPVNSQKHDSKTQSAKVELKLQAKLVGFVFSPCSPKAYSLLGAKLISLKAAPHFPM